MPSRHRIVTVLLLSSTAALASPAAHAPPPDAKVAPAVLALRAELRQHSEVPLANRLAHFRPLCDADGYPLVGNVTTKGGDADRQPSAVCALVRAQKPAS